MYEEAFFHLPEHCHRQYGGEALTLAGCAMNSVANGKVYHRSPFKQVYVQAAAGDAGGAIGSAMVTWNELSGLRPASMDHAYLGPRLVPDQIETLLQKHQSSLRQEGCSFRQFNHEEQLCKFTAEQIAVGKVVGWFQGRMEWGAPSLGESLHPG